MAKDPAFLFYSSDFLTGTMMLNNEQVGKFIRLLCAQHQLGHLSESDMINVCGTYDERVWSKFVKDNTGKYYNVRLEFEANKRKLFCESRRDSRLKGVENNKVKRKKDVRRSYVKRMEDVNENEYLDYCRGLLGEKYLPLEFSLKAKYEAWVANGWKDGNDKPIKNWKTKIKNTIPFLKPDQSGKQEKLNRAAELSLDNRHRFPGT